MCFLFTPSVFQVYFKCALWYLSQHQVDVNRSQGDYSQQLYSFKYNFYKNLVGIKTCQHGYTTNDFYFPTWGLSEPCYNQIMGHLGSYPHHLEYSFKREQLFSCKSNKHFPISNWKNTIYPYLYTKTMDTDTGNSGVAYVIHNWQICLTFSYISPSNFKKSIRIQLIIYRHPHLYHPSDQN